MNFERVVYSIFRIAHEKLVNLVNFGVFCRKAKVLCISVDMEQKKRLELEKQVFNVKRHLLSDVIEKSSRTFSSL